MFGSFQNKNTPKRKMKESGSQEGENDPDVQLISSKKRTSRLSGMQSTAEAPPPAGRISPTIRQLVRPSDPTKWWFCEEARWNVYLWDTVSNDGRRRQHGHTSLYKYTNTALVMTTDEGKDSTTTCSQCDGKRQCRVWRDKARKGKACAYCRLHNKSKCEANQNPSEDDSDFSMSPQPTEAGAMTLLTQADKSMATAEMAAEMAQGSEVEAHNTLVEFKVEYHKAVKIIASHRQATAQSAAITAHNAAKCADSELTITNITSGLPDVMARLSDLENQNHGLRRENEEFRKTLLGLNGEIKAMREEIEETRRVLESDTQRVDDTVANFGDGLGQLLTRLKMGGRREGALTVE